MAVEYEISSDVAVIKETGSVSQCARVTQMYSGQITYDDEAGSKFATATINGKSQRVMLCIAVNGTVNYDDVPSLYSTVDGHRCLNIVTPTETGTPDDVPSLYETVVIDGQNVRAVRCIMINKTPVYDGVSSTCTFTGDDGKTHTAQLVNKITGGSVVVIIKGTSPLNLPDAIANSLSYVKAFGGTEQGLPTGYTALTFVENTSGTYIDLGVPFNDADSELEVTMTAVNNTNYVASARDGNTMQGIAGSSTAFKAYIDPVSLTSTTTKTAGHKYKFTFTANNGNATFKTEDLTAETSDTQTTVYTVSQTQPTAHLGLFGNSYGNVTDTGADFYGLKYTVAGEVVLNLVPCRKGATIGVFDLVSRQFLTPTQGSLMAGTDTTLVPTPDAPMDIVCNNGVLKLGKPITIDQTRNYAYINTTGSWAWSSDSYSIAMPVEVGKKYKITLSSTDSAVVGTIFRYGFTDEDPEDFKQSEITPSPVSVSIYDYWRGTPQDLPEVEVTATHPYLVIQVSASFAVSVVSTYLTIKKQVVYADGTAETIEDTIGNTATAEMLLKIGDYQDVQSIIDGVVTRNVVVKVLDGTEDWAANTVSSGRLVFYITKVSIGSNSTVLPNGSPNIKCSHFEISTAAAQSLYGTVWAGGTAINFTAGDFCANLTAWKQWLADQYAAGTPVIIVYPLATPTTESVTGQTLQVQAGDNTLAITQAGMSGLELEAQYQAAVSLTIQEVQDANLDPNVKVTIS